MSKQPSLSAWPPDARPLARRILRFMRHSLRGAATEPFQDLALAIHRYQRAHDPVLASLSQGEPSCLADIPRVPVGLFKALDVGTVRPGTQAVAFKTSGTTGGGRGVHRLRGTALYDVGSVAWARQVLPNLPGRSLNLLLDPSTHPESSLSHMVSLFATHLHGKTQWFLRPTHLDREGFVRALAMANQPVFVGATSFALAQVLQARDLPPLPPHSVLMVTGGFKGRAVALDEASLYALAKQHLCPDHLATEYGMTELSSQLWGQPGHPYRPPPWLRVVAIDPATASPLGPGHKGQLCFYDLANLDSTLGIETLDEGIVHPDGSVSLCGRLAGAEARGCSLTVEATWQAQGQM